MTATELPGDATTPMFTSLEQACLDEAKAAWTAHRADTEAHEALEMFEAISWQAGYYARAKAERSEKEALQQTVDSLRAALSRIAHLRPSYSYAHHADENTRGTLIMAARIAAAVLSDLPKEGA